MSNNFHKYIHILRAIIPSIWFCFRHLPIRQAIKLPILLYKPRLFHNSGKFVINGPVKFGMIRLGDYEVSIYPNNGIMLENRGRIIFEGRCSIGNDSYISVGPKGVLTFGNNSGATTALKIACYHKINIGYNVLIGWQNCLYDTDFHKLTDVKIEGKMEKKRTPGFGSIEIGHDTWIGNGCKIYKGVTIPPFSVVGADTILLKTITSESFTLICNERAPAVKAHGIFRDPNDDTIEY